MVRIHPDPPTEPRQRNDGAIAQLGERLLCKQEVTGSIPVGSTRIWGTTSAECNEKAHLEHSLSQCILFYSAAL